jgi:hypothetical protein
MQGAKSWHRREFQQEWQTPFPGKRLSAGHPHLVNPQCTENCGKPLQFLKGENFPMGNKRHTFFWTAIPAAKIAAVCDGKAQIGDLPAVVIYQMDIWYGILGTCMTLCH